MAIQLRQAQPSDLGGVIAVEKEMYGVDYTQGTFLRYFAVFPEGFVVAEDTSARGERRIIGFVVTIRLRTICAIPYVHDPAILHVPDGDVLYLSGFGVDSQFKPLGVGEMLYSRVLDIGKALGARHYVVICMEGDPTDEYEIGLVKRFSLHKDHVVDWEIAPGRLYLQACQSPSRTFSSRTGPAAPSSWVS